MFIVSTQEKLRFQASSLKGTGATRDFMIRNVQGHSGAISRQVDLDKAHTRVTDRDDIPVLVHHTATSKLYQMLGTDDSIGLIPGGPPDNSNRELRNTTFCSTKLASLKGELPDRFRRRGTNCAVHLDVDLLFEAGIRLYRSAAGVILIPDLVDVKYIKRVTLITPPAFTLYSKPKQEDLNCAKGTDLHCLDCGTVHRRGCWRCFNCWESLTWAGVADRHAFILDSSERERELRTYYDLTPKQFDTVCKAPGSAINTLPNVRNARPDDEEETLMFPPWRQPGVHPSPQVALPTPSVAATARSGNAPTTSDLDPRCLHLEPRKIRELVKSARRGGFFTSHTDRWRRDLEYRAACNSHIPVTPEWLQFPSGNWARLDGVEELPPSSTASASSRR